MVGGLGIRQGKGHGIFNHLPAAHQCQGRESREKGGEGIKLAWVGGEGQRSGNSTISPTWKTRQDLWVSGMDKERREDSHMYPSHPLILTNPAAMSCHSASHPIIVLVLVSRQQDSSLLLQRHVLPITTAHEYERCIFTIRSEPFTIYSLATSCLIANTRAQFKACAKTSTTVQLGTVLGYDVVLLR